MKSRNCFKIFRSFLKFNQRLQFSRTNHLKMQKQDEEMNESSTTVEVPSDKDFETTLKVLKFLEKSPKHLYENQELLQVGERFKKNLNFKT
jgi:hypothetical protein